ncbi:MULTISPECIES: hypothetical protein [unclassified Nocardiopsis]|uniref:hypothetical protein n=1 Tax=Nocardiopsis TaxID=2013 RepID=UPI00387B9572
MVNESSDILHRLLYPSPEELMEEAKEMVHENAPRRFAVVVFDHDGSDAAIMAWGFQYSTRDFRLQGTEQRFRSHFCSMRSVLRACEGGVDGYPIEVMWVDEPYPPQVYSDDEDDDSADERETA